VQLCSIPISPIDALRIPVSGQICLNYLKDTWCSEANVCNILCLPWATDTHGNHTFNAAYSGLPFECNIITCDCGSPDCPKLLAIVDSIFFYGNTFVAFFDPLKGLYLPCCGKTVCWGSHPLELFHNTDFKGHMNCPLCCMPNLASQPSFSLLQEACLTNPSLPLPVKKAKVATTPRTSSMGTRSRSFVEKEKSSVNCPQTVTSPHSLLLPALLHTTHDMYTFHSKTVSTL